MTTRRPTATPWTIRDMLDNLIFVSEGRKVMGAQLLSLADFHGLTSASRMLVDDDKLVAVSKEWFSHPDRMTVGSVKAAYELRKLVGEAPPWIHINEEDDL